MRAFLGFVRKETLHLLRDRQTLAILILFPVVQVLIFGFAVRTDVRDIADRDRGPDARCRHPRAAGADRAPPTGSTSSAWRRAPRVSSGSSARAPSGRRWCCRATWSGGSAGATRCRSSSSPTAATRTPAASCRATRPRSWTAGIATRCRPAAALRIEATARMRYNPTLESAHLFVPGLVAFVLTIVSALMTAISITREKETGTMEMLLVSPIRPTAIVRGQGHALHRARLRERAPGAGGGAHGVRGAARGSLVLLLAESGLYIITALALGIVISTKAPNQRTAMIAALAGLMMPTLLLSGFIFPLDSLPAAAAVALLPRAGPVVPDHRARHHDQGRRPRDALAGDADPDRDDPVPPRRRDRAGSRSGWADAMRTVFFLVRKEFLQIFRDRTTVFQIFMIPVVQLLVLANAATFDVKQVRMLVVDEDRTTVSAGLVQRLEAGRQFKDRALRAERRRRGAGAARPRGDGRAPHPAPLRGGSGPARAGPRCSSS